jgi:Ca2+-binding RTX toxin-like protein
MATIVVNAASGIGFSEFDLFGLLDGQTYAGTATTFTVDYGDGTVDEFTGKKLRYDDDGLPTGGIVTGYRALEDGAAVVTVAKAQVKVKDMMAALGDPTPASLAKLMARILKKGDTFDGSDLADSFDGMAGRDKLMGNGGDDDLSGGKSNDTLFGGDGSDTLDGGAHSDMLFGDEGDDFLLGGGGNDRQVGGLGADEHTGGGGNDRFVFKTVEDSSVDVLGRDLITDFRQGQDKIDLKAIDADTGRKGNQAFKLIKDTAFSSKAGELRYESDGTSTFVYGDVDGDAAADFAIELTGDVVLKNGSFLL